MTQLVPPEEIEAVMGMRRSVDRHYGKLSTVEAKFYIMHSVNCRDSFADLRLCAFSQALDRGIDWDAWTPDVAKLLAITPGGRLVGSG